MELSLLRHLKKASDSKILMVVLDGLGGMPLKPTGLTELEMANTPHLDALVFRGICGLHQPVGTGITPGSGPGHLALFGYDPLKYPVGRGVLGALGIGFDLKPDDVAARGNFCSVDDRGNITDRRAGRISTEECETLCRRLREIRLPDAEIFIEPVRDYRFLLVIRGDGLDAEIKDTDPQETGKPPLPPQPRSGKAKRTAELVASFVKQAGEILSGQHPANMVLLRGFSKKPDLPLMNDVFGLKAVAIAVYPMYRGVSRLVGMDVIETGDSFEEAYETLKKAWDAYDFFYFHVKKIDSAGEDGNFDQKVSLIEAFDENVPLLMDLKPQVLIVTGDHSSPAKLKSHSWHPVPVLLWSPNCRTDGVTRFGEKHCIDGSLGPRFPAIELMPLALAHAMRLEKFGA